MSQTAEKMTPQDELEELLGFKAEPEPEGEAPPAREEEAPAAEVADEEPAPEPDETVEDAPSDEAPPVAAKTQGQPETAAERREKALRAEIAKLRQAARAREQAEGMRFAPAPVQPVAVEAAPKKPAGVPVRVSEDGSSVYVDPTELDRLIEERAARTLEERMKPTPEQVKAAHAQRTVQAFVSENPEAHGPVMHTTGEAMNFLNLSLRNAMQQTGAVAYTAEDLIAVARETGVADQVAEFFPDIAPHLEELIEADITDNVAWRARIMRRIAAGMASNDAGPDPAPVRSATPQLRSVAGAPRSLAAKGGTRSPSPSVDQQEFDGLEREFRKDVVFFPPEKRRRLEELGKKLSKAGYV